MQQLASGSLLHGETYRIDKVLGQGGFGITYLAEQVMLGRKVAIKEFFMKELCERDESTSHVTLGTEGSRDTVNRFREKFLKEARNIAKLNHPNIVRIIDVFEENGTAYYVMEYAEGGSLSAKVKAQGYLSEPVATRYILQVANALAYVHQRKMNHLDVKPANIMLNENDDAILIDFGLSKQYDATTGNQTSTSPVGISEGYAPMEQYKQGGVGEFSPETDIYALGATLFKLLTGNTPPSASDVNEDGVPVEELKAKGISQNIISTICKAMEGRKRDRYNSIQAFVDALKTTAQTTVPAEADEATIVAPVAEKPFAQVPQPAPVQPQAPAIEEPEENEDNGNKKTIMIIVAAVVAICLAIVLFFVLGNTGNKTETPVPEADTTTVVEQPSETATEPTAKPSEEAQTTKSYSDRHAAVINDTDGFTNIRAKKDSHSAIVKVYYEDEVFYYKKVSGHWYPVYETQDGEQIGYIFYNRVRDI